GRHAQADQGPDQERAPRPSAGAARRAGDRVQPGDGRARPARAARAPRPPSRPEGRPHALPAGGPRRCPGGGPGRDRGRPDHAKPRPQPGGGAGGAGGGELQQPLTRCAYMRLKPVAVEPRGVVSRTLSFEDNGRCAVLFGRHHEHLALLEQQLPVSLAARGNLITISGEVEAVDAAAAVLEELYRQLQNGLDLGRNEIDAAVRMAVRGAGDVAALTNDDVVIRTERRRVSPRSPTQAAYLRAMRHHDLVFGIGPAGTGKTYLAV